MGAILKEVKFNDKGVDVKLAALENETDSAAQALLNHTLVDYQGRNIVLVFVDPDTYNQDKADAVIEPDEPALPMEGTVHAAQAVDVVAAGETEKPLADADEPVPATTPTSDKLH